MRKLITLNVKVFKPNFTPFRWNFEKFLLDHNGQPVRRYDESLDPSEIIPDIEALMDNIPHSGDIEEGDEITTTGPAQ